MHSMLSEDTDHAGESLPARPRTLMECLERGLDAVESSAGSGAVGDAGVRASLAPRAKLGPVNFSCICKLGKDLRDKAGISAWCGRRSSASMDCNGRHMARLASAAAVAFRDPA